MSFEYTSNSPTRLRREPPREGAYIRLEQTKLAFPFGEGGLTRLSAAVKTEEVGTESFYNLFRLALLGTFPKGEGFK